MWNHISDIAKTREVAQSSVVPPVTGVVEVSRDAVV
jgi:hypothetical protein